MISKYSISADNTLSADNTFNWLAPTSDQFSYAADYRSKQLSTPLVFHSLASA
jgi:hypothetical protein